MKPLLLCTAFMLAITSCRTKETLQSPAIPQETSDYVYQYSIIDALLAGVYEGELTIGDLRKRGDFGIGTFNRLDGEMFMMEGKVFRMRSNGEVVEVQDEEKTPLAYVKFFRPDTTLILSGQTITYEGLKTLLAPILNENQLYAIRLKGHFSQVDARSVAPAEKPYPELAAYLAAGGQTSFTFENKAGICIGYVSPDFTARANVPGYHLHFLDDQHEKGGHVFGFQTDSLFVEIDRGQGFTVELNTHPDFAGADLLRNRKKELEVVEQKQ